MRTRSLPNCGSFDCFFSAQPDIAEQSGQRKVVAARANREMSIGYMRAKADFITPTVAEAHLGDRAQGPATAMTCDMMPNSMLLQTKVGRCAV